MWPTICGPMLISLPVGYPLGVVALVPAERSGRPAPRGSRGRSLTSAAGGPAGAGPPDLHRDRSAWSAGGTDQSARTVAASREVVPGHPHYVVLFFLDIAGAVVVIVAWFAILFTGRYPRGCSTSCRASPLAQPGGRLRVHPGDHRYPPRSVIRRFRPRSAWSSMTFLAYPEASRLAVVRQRRLRCGRDQIADLAMSERQPGVAAISITPPAGGTRWRPTARGLRPTAAGTKVSGIAAGPGCGPLASHGTKDPPTPARSPLRTGFAPLHGGSNRA